MHVCDSCGTEYLPAAYVPAMRFESIGYARLELGYWTSSGHCPTNRAKCCTTVNG